MTVLWQLYGCYFFIPFLIRIENYNNLRDVIVTEAVVTEMKKQSAGDAPVEDLDKIKEELKEMVPKVKDIALTFKNSAAGANNEDWMLCVWMRGISLELICVQGYAWTFWLWVKDTKYISMIYLLWYQQYSTIKEYTSSYSLFTSDVLIWSHKHKCAVFMKSWRKKNLANCLRPSPKTYNTPYRTFEFTQILYWVPKLKIPT